jgi:uncharacterized protein YbbK (DUF523 family)
MNILVSACLMGLCTRYDGKAKPHEGVLELAQNHTLIPVCPEQLGGLATPRPPAEIQKDGRVVNVLGEDVSAAYTLGAQMALSVAQSARCTLAILKSRSPSCGKSQVYDGSFQGILKDGNGIFAALCIQNGLLVYTEGDLKGLLESQ